MAHRNRWFSQLETSIYGWDFPVRCVSRNQMLPFVMEHHHQSDLCCLLDVASWGSFSWLASCLATNESPYPNCVWIYIRWECPLLAGMVVEHLTRIFAWEKPKNSLAAGVKILDPSGKTHSSSYTTSLWIPSASALDWFYQGIHPGSSVHLDARFSPL